ncbi:DoxX family protein [Chitinophaga rhizosphaerae]|uniref:DoxX family protein n=1 Tax=Chitinophaga rhizosphaerae TaxID=1864947 RepID=UPI000F805754|nr:DoxX family protein [Chitinophaga rhizosphaerae]
MRFPYLSLRHTLLILRISIAIIFIAHAVVRVTGGTVPRFGGFLESKGFPAGEALVWMITVFEIAGGILLAAGKFVRWLSAGFVLMLLVGIVIIHAELGWFVGEHGSGGCEYSFILIVALLVTAAADGERAA